MMKTKVMILFFLGCGILFYQLYAGPVDPNTANTLVLKNKAFVNDELVKVKDVVVMDTSMEDRIGSLVIAVSPDSGKTITLQKQEIYEKLVGNGVQSLTIEGPDSITVLRQGIVVQPAFFKDMIHRYIVTHSRWKDGVQVDIVTSKAIAVPESGIRWQLTPANGQDFFGSILFKVDAISEATNETVYSNWIVAKLKIVKSTAISNHTIQKNEIIAENDIRWETREITPFIKDALLDEGEIIGQKAGRIIRPNSVITEALLEKKFLVQRGDMATLVARLRGIKASSTVKALGNGGYGDTVQVINTQSQKIISAIVTGKNTLEVNVQ
jgi:flagella basal body P-ring formation protein FlgA